MTHASSWFHIGSSGLQEPALKWVSDGSSRSFLLSLRKSWTCSRHVRMPTKSMKGIPRMGAIYKPLSRVLLLAHASLESHCFNRLSSARTPVKRCCARYTTN
jgi:hypothetical protein